MMQAFDVEGPLLVCRTADAGIAAVLPMVSREAKRKGGLTFYYIDIERINEVPVRRYLDHFYLWVADNVPMHWQDLIDRFFEVLATDYETIIDIERNRENIRYLIQLVKQLVASTSDTTLIDFGCGTGLSFEIALEQQVKVIGVDRSRHMRAITASQGMVVWGPGKLAQQPHNTLHSAFASYVFHLLRDTHSLRLLWTRLKVGGVFVGNFHKGLGVELVTAAIRDMGGVDWRVESSSHLERHGPYMVFRKEM